jgi:hypothetical protein
VIEKNSAGVPDTVAQSILFDNAARLYHIDI